jgi:hypothetical protein
MVENATDVSARGQRDERNQERARKFVAITVVRQSREETLASGFYICCVQTLCGKDGLAITAVSRWRTQLLVHRE